MPDSPAIAPGGLERKQSCRRGLAIARRWTASSTACATVRAGALGCPQAYDLRERGASPVGEIALGMAIVNRTLSDLAARGLPAEKVAPSLAWVSGTDIDLFEEVAKFRALRRIWARTLKERFGADGRACAALAHRLSYLGTCAGLRTTAQQPFARRDPDAGGAARRRTVGRNLHLRRARLHSDRGSTRNSPRARSRSSRTKSAPRAQPIRWAAAITSSR